MTHVVPEHDLVRFIPKEWVRHAQSRIPKTSSHESHTSESNERLVDADDPLNSTGDQRGAWSLIFFKSRCHRLDADDGLEISRLSLSYLSSCPVSI